MIKKNIKSEKGISLVSLAIAITILVILTNAVIYNMSRNLKIDNLKFLQNDIDNLRNKISSYYAENGKIPAKLKYTNVEHLKNAGIISETVDTGDFLVIDLSAIENLTLNFGEDFEKIKNLETLTDEQAKEYTDLYIINEASHNIFFVEGIKLDSEIYYTDYTLDDIDSKAVEIKYFEGVRIPDGFYYVGGTKDTGIVISDVPGDNLENTKQGNQFVWVPVEDYSEFKRANWQNWDGTNEPSDLTSSKINIEDDTTDPTGKYDEMLESVKLNKGFYIARFEAGKETIDGVDTVVSKKNQSPWISVPWGTSITDIGTEGAVYKSLNFVKTNYTDKGKTINANSTLIYGIQWDAVMRWLSKDESLRGYITNSEGIGNFVDSDSTNNPANTGAVESYQMKNIYDLAGNVREWTMEQSGTAYKINRGGNYKSSGSEITLSTRSGDYPEHSDNSLGFRIALYLDVEEKWSPIYDVNGKYVDKNGDSAMIPAGFQVSQMPGEDTIDEGLVIQDEEKNQFVWIPVTSEEQYVRNTTYDKTEVSATAIDDTDYLPEGITDEKQVVLNAGGFYIGRYEAGDSSTTTDFRTSTSTEGTLVCQENKYPYTWVAQTDAKEIAKTFIDNDYVKSALISGTQWDVTMETVNGRLDSKGQNYDVITESSTRHMETPATTGQNIADKVYNIYDLEGNFREFLAEKNTQYATYGYVSRGGYYNLSSGAAATRSNYLVNANSSCAFRIVLYVL